MNTLSSPPTQQHRLQQHPTMSTQHSSNMPLAHLDEAKATLHESNCEWSNTPPATPVTPTDKIHKAMMIQSPLHLKQSLLSTPPSLTTMDVTTTGTTSLEKDTYPGRDLLAHSSNDGWDIYADIQSGLKMDYPKSSNQSFHDCVTSTESSSAQSIERHNSFATFYGMTEDQIRYQDNMTSAKHAIPLPALCNPMDNGGNLSDRTSPLASSCTSSVLEEDTCFSDGDQDTLSTASSLFGHLSKAQLIERVVQLEQEKRRSTLSTSSDWSSSVTQQEPKKKISQYDNTGQEQDIHICRWVNCRTQTSTLDELIAHLRDTHIGSGKASYHCEWIGCARNKKPFMKRHKMHNHLRTHTGERPFVCNVEGCEKRFSRPDSLNTHIRTHSNIRPYLCRVEGCPKAYFHSRSLRKHVKGHEAAGVFVPRPPARQAAINRKKHQPPKTTFSSPSPEKHDQGDKVVGLARSSSPTSTSSPSTTNIVSLSSANNSLLSQQSTTFPTSIHLPTHQEWDSSIISPSPSFPYTTSSSPSPSSITPHQLSHNYISISSASSPSSSASPSSTSFYAPHMPLSDSTVMNCSGLQQQQSSSPSTDLLYATPSSADSSSYIYALSNDYPLSHSHLSLF